ncbi:MAG: T9SS type A sorting domain-containing protein [Bacteroidota bacterium]
MRPLKLIAVLCILALNAKSQNNVYRDTIPVYENGNRLLSPWAGGINFSSFTSIDLNLDGKKDIVAYDKICGSGGKLKAFLNISQGGLVQYKHDYASQSRFPDVTDWALFFDYDNDGNEDLFTYNGSGGIKVFRNTSTLTTGLRFALISSELLSDYNPNGVPNMANIYCNSIALPGIGDIDGDGDLDILTYSVFGIKMEYHKNMSMERYGHADSLVYDMVDDCWGDVQENNCDVYLSQCPYLRQYQQEIQGDAAKVLHSGSCLMCFDRDGDGDQDLIMGDVSCSNVFYVENGGSNTNAHISDTTRLYPNYPNKGTTDVIKMNSFPCTYYLDVNNDGKKDLLASPNAVAGSENYQSVWCYLNASTTSTVNFVLQKKNFLQEDMIELGEGAYPVFFDADADGKKDIIVGNLGYYISGANKSKLAYYRNIGTSTAPSFSLITRDYQSLSALNIYGMAPTFGDLDGDNDADLIIGEGNGQLYYLENTAGASNPAVFSNAVANYKTIDAGNFAYPQLFDVDKNGTLDLLIGSQNGKIAYWKNTGTSTSPNFTLQTASLGNIDVKSYGFLTGFSTPYAFNASGVTKLIVGSEIGNLYLYDNIDGNLSGTFNRVDTTLFKINEGTRSAPCYEDITNDGKRDMVLGNYAGGIAFFNSINVNSVGLDEIQAFDHVLMYPNPASKELTIAIDDATFAEVKITLFDVMGKELFSETTYNKTIRMDVSAYSKGIYFVRLQQKNTDSYKTVTKKIMIE